MQLKTLHISPVHLREAVNGRKPLYVTVSSTGMDQPVTVDQILAQLFPNVTSDLQDDDEFGDEGNNFYLVIEDPSRPRAEEGMPPWREIAFVHFDTHGPADSNVIPLHLHAIYAYTTLGEECKAVMMPYQHMPLDVTLARTVLERGLRQAEESTSY